MTDELDYAEENRMISAIAQLPRDLAIIKMDRDHIMALAKAEPRNPKEILAHIVEQLQTYRTFAEEAIYTKPVGKDQFGRMKYARGPSIRMAEALAEAYGYNKVRCDVVIIDEDTVRVEATFTDYQRGRIWEHSDIVSKTYKDRDGRERRHSDGRFFDVVVKAAGSKCAREVILRSVPPGLRSELTQVVDEQLDAFLDEATMKKIIAQFSTRNVTVDMLERHLGKRIESLTKDDRKTLLGLWNSIKEGEQTVDGIFGAGETNQPTASPTGSPKTRSQDLADELAGPQPTEVAPAPPVTPGAPPAGRDEGQPLSPPAGVIPEAPIKPTAEPTITEEQYQTLHRMYDGISTGDAALFRKNINIKRVTDLRQLPASQFDDVDHELHSIWILKGAGRAEETPSSTTVTAVDNSGYVDGIHKTEDTVLSAQEMLGVEPEAPPQSTLQEASQPSVSPAAAGPLSQAHFDEFAHHVMFEISPRQLPGLFKRLGVSGLKEIRPPNPCPLTYDELLNLFKEFKKDG